MSSGIALLPGLVWGELLEGSWTAVAQQLGQEGSWHWDTGCLRCKQQLKVQHHDSQP